MTGMRAGVILVACIASGCSEQGNVFDRSAYEITSWTYNSDSCDQEGPAISRDGQPCRNLPTGCLMSDRALYVEQTNSDAQFVQISPCAELSDCAGKDGVGADVWLFRGAADDTVLSGSWGRANDVGGSCDGEYYELRLTAPLGDALVFETLTRLVTGIELDADGQCDLVQLLERGAGEPCATLEVITAQFAVDLPDQRP